MYRLQKFLACNLTEADLEREETAGEEGVPQTHDRSGGRVAVSEPDVVYLQPSIRWKII